MSTDILQKPIQLPFSGKTIKSRFLKSAMTERLATFSETDLASRGKPTPEYIESYRQWGLAELGVLVLGNIPVHREHLEAAGNAVIDPDSSWDPVEAFKPVIKASQATGSIVLGQLTHSGRQCPNTVQKEPVSASDNKGFKAMGMEFNDSKAMTVDQIKDYIRRIAYAAEVLYKAGADGIQLHAAHGYLLSQFLSPITNRRTDDYGGSFDNRARIVFEAFEAISEKVPDTFVRSIKINSQDFAEEGGWTVEECKDMVKKLEEAKVDLIELSGGNYENLAFEHKKESTKKREGFFVEFAEKIRPSLQKSVLAVTGGFRTAEKSAQAINDGVCDLIGMARPLCADPQLPANIFAGKSTGAAPNNIDSSLQTPAAVLQIHAIAEQRPIYDLSDDKVAKEVTEMITSRKPPAPKGDYPPM